MEFKEFNELLQNHVSMMCSYSKNLFTVDVDKDELWNFYLDSFPEGTNEIYRERREFDCSCCRNFIRNFGNVVTIKNNKLVSIWDFKTGDIVFQCVINELNKFITSKKIDNVFVTKTNTFGTLVSREKTETDIISWYHFHAKIPKEFVSDKSVSEESEMADYRDTRNVFKRSLDEISIESTETILDLISQNSLYKGEEWKSVLDSFLSIQKEYAKISEEEKDNYCWIKSLEVGGVIGRIRNHSMGTLLIDLQKTDLDDAVRKYEAMVAPINYKRPKAIYTKAMIEKAKKTIEELNMLDSLPRRFANIDDITINNILFADKDVRQSITGNSVFDKLESEVGNNTKSFDKVEEVPIDKFVKDILPKAKSLSMFLENKHIGNMMSLIAPVNKDAVSMFKWNNFSWAYNGNITDAMKERVKSLGGKVDGVLRASIMWNEKGENNNDFDLHCIEPNGNEIYFSNKGHVHYSSGMLDVDIRRPAQELNNGVAVENIIYTDKSKMPEGKYAFFVHNFSHNGGRTGFTAEIEFDNQVYLFNYNKELRSNETVQVAEVYYSKTNGFKVVEKIPSSVSSRDVWNLKTNQFHKVSVVMLSPNYWDDKGIGNKHYFFMLDKCINDTNPNGFFNEFLKEELMVHKKVFEALGSEMRVADSDNQLSGVGFSSTQRNEIVCKVEGSFTRTIKIIF